MRTSAVAFAATSAAAERRRGGRRAGFTRPVDRPLPAPAAAPDPVPTAIAVGARARSSCRDERINPLGLGDWRAAKAEIGAFYADRGFRPIWVDADGLTPPVAPSLTRVARAPEDGLTLGGLALPHDLVGPLDPEALAAAEAAIAAAVVAYAEQATGARLSPYRLSPILAADPQIVDPAEALAETAAASDPGARLAAFNPPQKGYRALRETLQRMNDAAASTQNDLGAAASDAPALERRSAARRGRRDKTGAGPSARCARLRGDPGCAQPACARAGRDPGQHGDVALGAARHGRAPDRGQHPRLLRLGAWKAIRS